MSDDKLFIKKDNRLYEIVYIGDSDDDANAFMSSNPGTGVLEVKGTHRLIAYSSDAGVPISYANKGLINKSTKVIFRKYEDGDLIAVFPDIKEGASSVLTYMTVGQHSAAYLEGVMGMTVAAVEAEYEDLKTELESIGYTLEIVEG